MSGTENRPFLRERLPWDINDILVDRFTMVGADLLVPPNDAPAWVVFIAAGVLQLHCIGAKGQNTVKYQ